MSLGRLGQSDAPDPRGVDDRAPSEHPVGTWLTTGSILVVIGIFLVTS